MSRKLVVSGTTAFVETTKNSPIQRSSFPVCLRNKARFRRRTFHEPNLIRIKTDSNYLDRLK